MKIQLKRSNVLISGQAKQPSPEQMEYGELAVNYNGDDIAIFIKDDSDNIRRISGASEKGDTLPESGKAPGDVFFDTSTGKLYFWTGSRWALVISDESDGSVTIDGDGTFTGSLSTNGFNSSNGIATSPGVYVSNNGGGADSVNGAFVSNNSNGNQTAIIYSNGTSTFGTSTNQSIHLRPGQSGSADAIWLQNADNSRPFLVMGNGGAKFTGDVKFGTTSDASGLLSSDRSITGTEIGNPGYIVCARDTDTPLFLNYKYDPNNSNYANLAIARFQANGSDVAQIFPDGKATFAGDVKIGDADSKVTGGINLTNNGYLAIRRPDSLTPAGNYSAFEIYSAADANSAVAQIFANGTAVFAGDVNADSVTANTAYITNAVISNDLTLNGNGTFAGYVKSTNHTEGECYIGATNLGTNYGFLAANGENVIAGIKMDGSGNFSGGVSGRYFYAVTPNGEWNSFINQGGSTNKNTVINNGSSDVITFNNDGSASFASTVNVGGNPDTAGQSGTKIFPSGTVRTRSPGTSSSDILFEGYGGSESTFKFRVTGDGNATFRGRVAGEFASTDAYSETMSSMPTSFIDIRNSAKAPNNMTFMSFRGSGNSGSSTGVWSIGAVGSPDGNGFSNKFAFVQRTADSTYKERFSIDKDGVATFGGKIDSSELVVYKKTSSVENCIRVFSDVGTQNDVKVEIKSDGSALFKGKLESQSIIKSTSNSGFQSISVDGGAMFAFRAEDKDGNQNVTLYSDGSATFAGQVDALNINSTSDIALKKDITPIEGAVSRLSNIEGVGFAWEKTGDRTYGVIAQDVEKEFPELVHTTDFKSVNYNGLVGVLIEAVKELKAEIEELKKG